MMEAVSTSETSVCFHQTTRHYIPEGCHIHTRRYDNLKSHTVNWIQLAEDKVIYRDFVKTAMKAKISRARNLLFTVYKRPFTAIVSVGLFVC
jgi:hypothetical protein